MACSAAKVLVIAEIVLVSMVAFSLANESTEGISPNEAIAKLMEGNRRFVTNKPAHPNQKSTRRYEVAAHGQKPFVSILCCADSRVPPEVIFDAGLGDLFVVRVAGNIADPTELGSLEYGVGHLGTKLLVVLGHTKCGAVTAACTDAKVGGNIPSIIDNIIPAVKKTRAAYKGTNLDEFVNKTIKANVWQTVEDIFKRSEELRTMVSEGKLKIIGALYDLETGEVTNIGIHTMQEELLHPESK